MQVCPSGSTTAADACSLTILPLRQAAKGLLVTEWLISSAVTMNLGIPFNLMVTDLLL